MSAATLFISYGHRDMQPMNWLERLQLYLAPSRQEGVVEIWDDSKIEPGDKWREQIKTALGRASSAIFLVGPAFLASDFVRNQELPVLLEANNTRGCRIYPVVVGYSAYDRSVLKQYQAFNDPNTPLEALSLAEQNRILNELSKQVDQDLRSDRASSKTFNQQDTGVRSAMREIAKQLEKTRTAFEAQCLRRDRLVQIIKKRLRVRGNLEYENFFFRYFGDLDREERFQFWQIRAITEGPVYGGNREMLSVLEKSPEIFEQIPALADLRQHLVFWLNKYEKVFIVRPEMCLLYTGVEDGVPFPAHIDEQVENWMKENS
jgi:TIR domain-containing protein